MLKCTPNGEQPAKEIIFSFKQYRNKEQPRRNERKSTDNGNFFNHEPFARAGARASIEGRKAHERAMISARLSFQIINESEIEILGSQRHGLGHVNSDSNALIYSNRSIQFPRLPSMQMIPLLNFIPSARWILEHREIISLSPDGARGLDRGRAEKICETKRWFARHFAKRAKRK